jgi:hypothetical protein
MTITKNEKTECIEINLQEYTKDELIVMISYMHGNNLTFNEALAKLIKSYLNQYDENQLPLL